MAIQSTNRNFNNLTQYARLLKKSYRGGNATAVNKLTVNADVMVGSHIYGGIGASAVEERHAVTCVLLSNGEIVFEGLPPKRPDNLSNHGFHGRDPYVVRIY